jgi:DNA-binding GntR family transcriptional regulator
LQTNFGHSAVADPLTEFQERAKWRDMKKLNRDRELVQETAPRGRPKGTGGQRVYDEIRGRILRLELAPGIDISEPSLVEEFGISRTPVREALIRLASEGLVTLLPNRGARVTALDLDSVRELFDALELCQRATSRWAALRAQPEDVALLRKFSNAFTEGAKVKDYRAMSEANRSFHDAIALAAGNRHLSRLAESLSADTLRLAEKSLPVPLVTERHPAYFDVICRQHEEIIDLIAAKNAEGAEKLARDHARLFRARVLNYLATANSSEVGVDLPP